MTADAFGGVFSYSIELARALLPHGIEVVLATMGPEPSEAQRAEVARIPNLELHSSRFKLEWMEDPWADVNQAGEWLLDLERRTVPDVVHLNGYAHGALPFQAPKLVVAHSCVLSSWEAVKREPLPHRYEEYRLRVQDGLSKADAIVAPSRAMVHELERHYGPGARAALIITNACDPAGFSPGTKRPFALTAGRPWDEAKNILALDAGVHDWPLFVAGETRSPDGNLIKLARLISLGPISRDTLAKWFRAASIYVAPAKYEPFGLSVLEAALSGCALVLSDIPTFRELWEGAALFAPPEEPAGFASLLRWLCSDARARGELALKARTRAASIRPETMGLAYRELYRRLASERGDAPTAHGRGSAV
jgi:glycosyltransferase involved in cell wall biosynthesis